MNYCLLHIFRSFRSTSSLTFTIEILNGNERYAHCLYSNTLLLFEKNQNAQSTVDDTTVYDRIDQVFVQIIWLLDRTRIELIR